MIATAPITLRLLTLAAGFAILVGCASVPRPVQDLEEATAALESARANGAPQLAEQQWQAAQENLARATQLLEQRQNAAASRALQQATADAKLAAAKAQLQMRVDEQQALRMEIEQLQQRIEEVKLNTREPVQE